ncbi:hypothetical protein CLOP_g24428 [Closterium sp. NIES-67]|nr:hypothetical protein CLOP_g24428 [Closterium sp. NIES-67]
MDHYAVLGVRRDASAHEIKAAYRRQAMKWHPDRVHAARGGARGAEDAAAARFRAIAEAYEVLGNEARRRAYNSRRQGWRQRQAQGGGWASAQRQGGRQAGWDTGGRGGSSSSSSSYWNHQQQQQQQHYRHDQQRWQQQEGGGGAWGRVWSQWGRGGWVAALRRGMGPADLAFHAAIGSLLVGGLVLGGTAGDYLWASANRGVSAVPDGMWW